MAWSEEARAAALQARRAKAKGTKPAAQLRRATAKYGNPYPVAKTLKDNYKTAKSYAASSKYKGMLGGKTPRQYAYAQTTSIYAGLNKLKGFK